MAVELNRVAMLGIGLLAKLQQKVEDLIEGYAGEEAEKADFSVGSSSEAGLNEEIENLVELGEEKYDEWVERVRGLRESFVERTRESMNDIVSSLGLVTREQIEEMECKVSRMERISRMENSN
jgi:polyhydroxyalkanoate synthesis regulator phasin